MYILRKIKKKSQICTRGCRKPLAKINTRGNTFQTRADKKDKELQLRYSGAGFSRTSDCGCNSDHNMITTPEGSTTISISTVKYPQWRQYATTHQLPQHPINADDHKTLRLDNAEITIKTLLATAKIRHRLPPWSLYHSTDTHRLLYYKIPPPQ